MAKEGTKPAGGPAPPPAGFVPSFIPIAFCCLGDL